MVLMFRVSLNRLLHAAPDQREEEESVLQQELISDLSELYQTSQGADKKTGKKRMYKAYIQKFNAYFNCFCDGHDIQRSMDSL